MDGDSGGRAAGMLDRTSDSPSSSRLRRRVSLSAPMPSSFDARSSNDLAVVASSRARLIFDPSSSANHKQTTGFSSNTVISSSSSGTIVSTTNTSRSSGSSLHLYLFDDEDDGTYTLNKAREETEKKRMNNIKSLVQEFFGASSSSSSANCTIDSGDMSVLERWFTELGVGWVLHISDVDASIAVIQPDHTLDPRSWIRALNEIMETIRLTPSFFSDRGFEGMPSIWKKKKEKKKKKGKKKKEKKKEKEKEKEEEEKEKKEKKKEKKEKKKEEKKKEKKEEEKKKEKKEKKKEKEEKEKKEKKKEEKEKKKKKKEKEKEKKKEKKEKEKEKKEKKEKEKKEEEKKEKEKKKKKEEKKKEKKKEKEKKEEEKKEEKKKKEKKKKKEEKKEEKKKEKKKKEEEKKEEEKKKKEKKEEEKKKKEKKKKKEEKKEKKEKKKKKKEKKEKEKKKEKKKKKKEEEDVFFRKSVRELSNYIIRRGENKIQKEEKAEEAESCIPDQFQFARFIQETMLKMLAFVDFLVALDPNTICEFSVANGSGVPEPALYQKISILLRVLDALSNAFFEVEVLLLSMPSESEEVKRIRGETINLLYAKDNKATEAVWGTMQEIWALIMESMEEDGQDSVMTTQGSSDIHKVTLSVINHIRYLWANHWSVTSIVFSLGNKKHVTETGDTTSNPLASLTIEMVSCLEEKLAKMSQSFTDQGLRYMFLINNSTYILQQLQTTYGNNFLRSYFAALDRRIEGYIQAYLKLCWVPVLSCLLNPTPHCFWKSYSPLPKFEYEFEKICTTQKLWKVPDPELRKRMRDAITTKIILGYTRYIEDNKVSTTKLTPQNLKEMLQELFEG
ncbi:uncharacterized protein [Miscanthus floridulus]|uniref:uncharacterized protein isoform X1 n=1 Tax=Miscanthus floridulus TaxID=154761 RepID=UPI0034574CD3